MKRPLIPAFLMFVISLVTGLLYHTLSQEYHTLKGHPTSITLQISKGSSARDIAALLKTTGVISSPYLFYGAIRLTNTSGTLKSGEYEFPRLRSLKSVIARLVQGDVLYHRLTLPEGLTSREIQNLLGKNEILSGPLPDRMPEGSLLPETYTFERGMTRQALVALMTRAFHKAFDAAWINRALTSPFKTKNDVLILASIIEKETSIATERPHVAGVFINRLRLNMPLQTDPTIIYALEQQKGSPLGRPLLRGDLTVQSPYNTYIHQGLPPGPICHPGIASINAALNPLITEDLYFVATGTGAHTFSKTYKDHAVHHVKLNKARREK